MASEWESAEGWEDAGGWENPSTSTWEDIKISTAGIGDVLDRAWSGSALALADVFGDESGAEDIYTKLQQRIKERAQWANPEQKKQSFGGKVLGTVATLPGQLAAFPFSPFETGQRMIEQGETLPRSLAGTGIDTAGNIVGTALPGAIPGKLATRAATGAGINAAQDVATRAGIAAVAEQPETKELLGPSWESAALSGIVGAGLGGALGKKPSANKTDLTKLQQELTDLEAQITKTPKKETTVKPTEEPLPMIDESLLPAKVEEEKIPTGEVKEIFDQIDNLVKEEVFTSEEAASMKAKLSLIQDEKIPTGEATELSELPKPNLQVIKKPTIPPNQRGALDVSAFTKDSPEVLEAKKALLLDQKRAMASEIVDLGGTETYTAKINTPEKVIALADKSKDITAIQKIRAKTITPGIRRASISSNNPLLRYVRDVTAKVFTEAENYSRRYLTNEGGFGHQLTRLSPVEKVQLHKLIKMGDKHQHQWTVDNLPPSVTPKVREALAKYYEIEDVKFTTWNLQKEKVGLEPTEFREGHAPGIFSGDYWSLVTNKGGHMIGYIGEDTKWGYKQAVKDIQSKYPDYKITPMKRNKLGGSGPRSDVFSGLQDLLFILKENDPAFKEIQDFVDNAIAKNSNALFGASNFELVKKGIWGNEGNKPWKYDEVGQANDFFKAYLLHWEEGMLSHLNLPAEQQIRGLLNNPALNMPRAKEYADKYIKSMTGRSVGSIGQGLNLLWDNLFFAPLGLGPSYARETVNQVNKRLGQLTMGHLNLPFTALQFLQIAQTAVPEFVRVAGDLGSPAKFVTAQSKGSLDSIRYLTDKLLGKEATNPFVRGMYKYAEDKGLLTFSEFEDVGKITQNKYAKSYDAFADINRKIGEQGTRPLTFFIFSRLLEDTGMKSQEIFDTAYNLTQDAMVDYSSRERPMMFKDLGVMGQLAGGLQTFAVNYVGQQARWVNRAFRHGEYGPLISGLGAAVFFSGLTGLPFYQELDQLYQELTDKFGDRRRTISETVLKNLPDWLKDGTASTLTDLNIQSRMSAADVLPNSLGEAVTPYTSKIGRIGKGVLDFAESPDQLSASQLLRDVAPSSLQGVIENNLLTSEPDKTGQQYILNREGQYEYPRTEFDMSVRRYGMMSLEESKKKQQKFQADKTKRSDDNRRKEILDFVKRKINIDPEFTTTEEYKSMVGEWILRGGNPETLANSLLTSVEKSKQTAKQRAERIPQSLQGARNWEYYNAP